MGTCFSKDTDRKQQQQQPSQGSGNTSQGPTEFAESEDTQRKLADFFTTVLGPSDHAKEE